VKWTMLTVPPGGPLPKRGGAGAFEDLDALDAVEGVGNARGMPLVWLPSEKPSL